MVQYLSSIAVVTIYYKFSGSKTQVRNQGTGKFSWFSAFLTPEARCQQGCVTDSGPGMDPLPNSFRLMAEFNPLQL